jgi:putative membrane protein
MNSLYLPAYGFRNISNIQEDCMRTKQWTPTIIAMSLVFAWAGLGGLSASAAAPPESAKSTAKTKTSPSMMSDSEFAKAAAEGGFAEVKFGELAKDRGSSQAVKDFGQRMVTDHSKADDNLKTAAAKDNLSLSAQLNAKDQAAYDRLSKLSGKVFDRAYARDMVRDHEADIAAFRHEANAGKDASIKSFASQTLPTLEDHLKQARQTLHAVEPKTTAQAKKQAS